MVIPALNRRVQGLIPATTHLGGIPSKTSIKTNQMSVKKQIRQNVRRLRRQLSDQQQQQAGDAVATSISAVVKQLAINRQKDKLKVALFLSMDGEISTKQAITQLWHNKVDVYLPRIHPFNPTQLIFIQYTPQTPLIRSHLGMLEPQLNCSNMMPLLQLDIIFTPLVAFDANCHRLGMGGGFYDRTLVPVHQQTDARPKLIGIAHNCQQVEKVPIDPWDLPLDEIITPDQHIKV